ncbi:hypothetical protein ACIBG8_07365 [Nonomuraea sp. NPDC050556]|uniref:hypothetical protein n=1 Tax=Nonomuraea sp. NPDC050556 TaxID=3364369 RepID=UPI0037BC7177
MKSRPSNADRQVNAKPRGAHDKCVDGENHLWKPLSFVFETQLLDAYGRVRIRQPKTTAARVYCVCLGCRSWTYVEADWVGYYLGGPEHVDPTLDNPDEVFTKSADPEPCEWFVRVSQPYSSCDRCGKPAWEHRGQETYMQGGPFDAAETARRLWARGEADHIRQKWESF